MSRSYKKFPGHTDYHSAYTKWAKRQASKAVRKADDVDNGKFYRKIFNSWNIRDYVCIWYSKESCEKRYNEMYADKEVATKMIKKSFRK